jgi:hypothetical protein
MFGRRIKDDSLWKIEYIDTVYKVYDWDKNLTGYFFPNYGIDLDTYHDNSASNDKNNDLLPDHEIEENIIEQMVKEKETVRGGNLMLPMVKLQLLDHSEGIHLDYVISSLEENAQRTKKWKQWISDNREEFQIFGNSIYTAREDRNILSIVLGLGLNLMLDEKELCKNLRPLLDKLHQDGLI